MSDGWSAGILFREMETLNPAFVAGEASPLPELTLQYKDFALWQRQALQGEVLERQLAYWKRQLQGPLPVLELPTDRPRVSDVGWRGGSVYAELPEDLSGRLRELSQAQGCTLFMTLMVAFMTLLHRYTGQEDILVGTPIANRNRMETEQLIGFFVNTLVLRADLSGYPTFRSLLGRVRGELAGSLFAPGPALRAAGGSCTGRDLSQSPLFQVMFVFDTTRRGGRPGRLVVSPVEWRRVHALRLDPGRAGRGGVAGRRADYRAELFDAEYHHAPAWSLPKLLGGAQDPIRRSRAEPFSKPRTSAAAVDWRHGKGRDSAVCASTFRGAGERTPEAVGTGVRGRTAQLAELNARANRLAHGLKKCGVGPDTWSTLRGALVGMWWGSSNLKAGAAYVPLDPGYPAEAWPS